jgi:hypothetical protein
MNALDILSSSATHMLYDSDAYAVVHVQPTEGDMPLAPHLPVLAAPEPGWIEPRAPFLAPR